MNGSVFASAACYIVFMIKCLIFDLGNVIVPFSLTKLYAQMAGLTTLGADLPARVRSTNLFVDFEAGRIRPEDFARQLCRLLDVDVEYGRFCSAWESIFDSETLIPEEIIESLAARYRTLLLSNTNVLHFEFIRRRYPLMRHFHGQILSYEVGCLKPDPRIYAAAIAEAACPPEQIFYTDDIAAYVDAARAQGIDAVQFQSLEQLLGELRARGIGDPAVAL